MSIRRPRQSELWNRRAVTSARRRKQQQATMFRGVTEQLEPRAMLAVTVTPVIDWNIDIGASTPSVNNTANAKAGTNSFTNTDKWVLDVVIDNTDAVQDVYMRVVNNNYIFATDPGFAPASVIYQHAGNISYIYSLPVTTGFFDAAGKYTAQINKTFTANFDTIYVRLKTGSNFVDGNDTPSFTIVGSSQNVAKTVIVDLVDRSGATPESLSDSAISVQSVIRVSNDTSDGFVGGYQTNFNGQGDFVGGNVNPLPQGSPIDSKAGGVYAYAESISLEAGVTTSTAAASATTQPGSLVLDSQIGASNQAAGAARTISLLAGKAAGSVVVPGDVTINVQGTGFTMGAGGKLTGNTTGTVPAASVTLSAQDADVVIGGTVEAVNHSYFLMPSASQTPVARTLTTKVNGVQKGRISGGTSGTSELLIYLANDAAGAGSDGTVDIQTSVGTLRSTSLPGTTLDYAISVKNDKSLTVDAVARSQGDIALSTTAGTIDLQAAIDTVGGFSLSSFTDLVVDSPVSSASGVVLTSTTGKLTTSAAITAGAGTVLLSAAKDVTVASLVSSVGDVRIVSTAGAIKSGANLTLDPTSRATAPSLFLSAATGIDLGTSTRSLEAVVTGAGALKIDDADAPQVDPQAISWGGLVVAKATTASGDVSVASTQSIDLQSLVAGGNGNASVTSSGTDAVPGDISVGSVIADGNAVLLSTAKFDTDGVTVLRQGFVSGNAPVAAEINWTAADVVDGAGLSDDSLYRNIPVISAYRLSAGDVIFNADNSVTLKAIKTTDGGVNVTSAGGSIVATSVVAASLGGAADVTLLAQGGGVTLGAVVADGSVAITAAQGIADDGNAATIGITADVIKLSAAAGGVASDIGSATSRVSLAVRNATGVALTIDNDTSKGAIDAQRVYVGSASSLELNAEAVDLVDVQASGALSDLNAQSVNATDPEGQITLSAGRDLTAGAFEVGDGAFGTSSSVSLKAGRNLAFAAGSSVKAETLSLTAAQFPGQTDLTSVDDVNHFAIAATSASSLDLRFNRATDVILDRITTVNGNITITNLDTGAILVGSGGVTAGTAATNNSVTISSQSDIAGYEAPPATGAGGVGAFAVPAASAGTATPAVPSATMTAGWERVAPLGSRTSSTSVVSWQGSAATAFTDRWVVKASNPSITSQSLFSAFRSRSATSTWTATSLGEGYYSVVAPRATQASVLAWANTTAGIAFAQPDFVITGSAVPNDPSYGQLWGLNNTTNPAADIDAPAAWDITTGSRSTVVAVIDTGVDYNHPDLAANMWRNPGETPGDGIDNDANGFVDDVYGWDFANNDADPMDDNNHGTHCAGTIGGVGNNGVGVVGVNWQVSIMALKFLGASNSGSISAAIACVNYATMMRQDHGVNVVATNNSWGGGGYSQTLKDAIKAGGDAGILFIAAAGNAANDNDANPSYPASYNEPSIIAVAATDSSNNLASFSSYGATSVDVGAPGVGILSTTRNNTYSTFNGTSMATPHVAGIAALLASAYPSATASQIRAAILSSTVAIPALAGKVATGGLVNAPAALAALGALAGSGTITAGGLVTLTAEGDITANTAAGQLAATAGGELAITQGGDVKIAGIAAKNSVTLDVTGSVATSSGKFLTSPLATVKATGGISLATDVTTLSAVSSGGSVTAVETDGLAIGADGIKASGTVGITLNAGNLAAGGATISGSAVGIKLLAAGDLDVDTSAGSLTASTKDGNVTIRNDKGFTIGTAGVVAGNGKDVTLTALAGGITGGAGAITATNATLTAAGGIAAATKVDTLTATATAGDIAISQTGKAIKLASLLAANGGVTVTNNDDITATSVQAIGLGKNVAITATGTAKKITVVSDGIVADGDAVTLTASGAIVGTKNGATPDVKAATAALAATGGDLTATLQAATVTAMASGNLDVALLGSKTVFLAPTSATVLSAGGNLTLRTGKNNVVVVNAPTVGTGKTTTYETAGRVTFAVTGTAATGAGSLAKAVADASAATVVGGTRGVAFSTAVTSPIQLNSTIDITNKVEIDGTQRINLSTGALSFGSRINIDGSKLTSTSSSGFRLTTNGASTSSGSWLRGLAFYGFSRGAAIEIAPTGDSADIIGVTVQGTLFGTSTAGLLSANRIGILAQNTSVGAAKAITGLTIADNTIVRSTDAGIRLGATVADAAITGNLIGVNSARTALGNAYGVDIVGAGKGNTVGAGNVIANNSTAGVRVSDTDASGGSATTIRGGEFLQNVVSVLVAGATKKVVVAGTTVIRNTTDGIRVTDTAEDVTIGGAAAADRNFIGTTATGALGLGNTRNGVSVSSTKPGVTIHNNTILGNGTGNVLNDNAGVKLSGTDADTKLIGNTITSNRGAGVLAVGSAKATLTRNVISSNTLSGVLVSSGTLVVGGDKAATDPALRQNANTLESNGRYGVEVLASAFAQVAGNAMNVNRLAGIFNANAGTAGPVIGTVTRSTAAATNGLLTVNFTGLANGDVVHVYSGSPQGRVYLGQFTYGTVSAFTDATGTKFTMTLGQQTAAGVASSVFVGGAITATRTAAGNTSAFATVRAVTRVA